MFSVVFFLLYLLSHEVSRKMRQSLILLNEIHFALLYLLQINLISNVLDREGSLCREILLQLGNVCFRSRILCYDFKNGCSFRRFAYFILSFYHFIIVLDSRALVWI